MNQNQFEVKRNEFLAIVNRVVSIPRPRINYADLSSPTFAACEFLRRLMEIQGFFMAHCRATGKLPATRKEIEHIPVASMDLTPTRLAAMYCACSDKALISLLVDLELEEVFTGLEFERRLADKRIGTVMILQPLFTDVQPTEEWLTRKLKTTA